MSANLRGNTFVYNPGTANETSKGQVAIPFTHIRLTGQGGLPEIVRQVNLLDQAAADATIGARSMPFCGPLTYFVSYSFTNNVPATLVHRLGTTNVRVWLGHQSDYGQVKVKSVDTNFVTVLPNASFTADVMFLVIP